MISILIIVLFGDFVKGIQFSFIPSPPITILQSAVYQCILTDVGQSDPVSVHWNVSGIYSNSLSWQSYITSNGITAVGNDTARNTTLTIPGGNTTLNQTTVTCIAVGHTMINSYMNTSSDTLYIQGKPASVHLTCSLYSVYTIQCNWSIPYTIMGINITGYNINITNNSILVHQSFVTNTEYFYNVSQFGVYSISVSAVISDLEGEIDTMMIEVPEVTIDNWSLGVNSAGSIQTVNCTIMDTQFINIIPVKMVITADIVQYTLVNINSYSSIIIGVLEWSYGRHKLNVSLMVEYDNGLQVYSSGNRILNTFHVQNVAINSFSEGTVCFECVFIPGINSVGCFINFTTSQSILNRQFTMDTMDCQYDIVTELYHVLVYDIESNGTIYSTKPAYTTSTMITGIMSNSPPADDKGGIDSINALPGNLVVEVIVPIVVVIAFLILFIALLLLYINRHKFWEDYDVK